MPYKCIEVKVLNDLVRYQVEVSSLLDKLRFSDAECLCVFIKELESLNTFLLYILAKTYTASIRDGVLDTISGSSYSDVLVSNFDSFCGVLDG